MVWVILILLVALLATLAAAVLLMAHSLLRPPRMTDGKAVYLLQRLTPDDMGMAYEPLTFTVRDDPQGRELNVATWWIPHPTGGDRTVVLIHGYADAKVGAIAWAPTWRALGYHILAIDLRAHGQSGGKFITAGVRERHDLDQVLNQLRAAKPSQTERLVLFGISLGGAVALATAAIRDDIGALVLDSPIADFRSGARAHADLLGLPLPSMLPLVMKVAGWLSDAALDSVQPIQLIRELKCPVMAIQSGDDPFVPPSDAAAIREAVQGRTDTSRVWQVDGTPHLMALTKDPQAYQRQIGLFLTDLAPAQ